MQRLLRVRAQLKKKKPTFKHKCAWRGGSIAKQGYRKPKGVDNKSRMKLKNKPKMANIGYSSPKVVRGYHPSGLDPKIVHNVMDLKNLKTKLNIVIIAASVGLRKKREIVDAATKKKLKIANPTIKKKEDEK